MWVLGVELKVVVARCSEPELVLGDHVTGHRVIQYGLLDNSKNDTGSTGQHTKTKQPNSYVQSIFLLLLFFKHP